MDKKKVYVIILVSLLIMTLNTFSGCLNTDDSEETSSSNGLEIISHNGQLVSFNYWIRGTVKNNAGRMVKRVKVKANFYNSEDSYIGSDTVSVGNMADGYTKQFDIHWAPYSDIYKDVNHYTLSVYSGW